MLFISPQRTQPAKLMVSKGLKVKGEAEGSVCESSWSFVIAFEMRVTVRNSDYTGVRERKRETDSSENITPFVRYFMIR